MKATFEFQLPEEQQDYDTYRMAVKYSLAIDDFSNHLRSVLKYETGMDGMLKAKKNMMLKVYEMIHEQWYEILRDNGVTE